MKVLSKYPPAGCLNTDMQEIQYSVIKGILVNSFPCSQGHLFLPGNMASITKKNTDKSEIGDFPNVCGPVEYYETQ